MLCLDPEPGSEAHRRFSGAALRRFCALQTAGECAHLPALVRPLRALGPGCPGPWRAGVAPAQGRQKLVSSMKWTLLRKIWVVSIGHN